MALIEKRGPGQYRVRVRRKGESANPITKTFESREAATKWARRIESELDAGKHVLFLANAETNSMTLRTALERLLTKAVRSCQTTSLLTVKDPRIRCKLLPRTGANSSSCLLCASRKFLRAATK
jgi:diphthamide biosynthesis methyltransferase